MGDRAGQPRLLAACRRLGEAAARPALVRAILAAAGGGAGEDLLDDPRDEAAAGRAVALLPLLPAIPRDALAVFDALSPDRHRCGGWSTPVTVAADLCRHALKAAPPGAVRAVDPACGSGAFLEGLVAALGPEAVLSGRVTGIERDPAAAEAARVRLFLLLGGAPRAAEAARKTISTGDALLGPEPAGAPFGLLAMNPPYVPAYSRQSERTGLPEAGELRARFGAFAGRLNLFCCFLLRARDLLAPDGAGVFLLPDAFATGDSYAGVREALSERFPRLDFLSVREPLFPAGVRSLVLFTGPGPARLRATAARGAGDLANAGRLLAAAPGAEWGEAARPLAFASELERDLWRRLRKSALPRLASRFTVRDGVNPGPRHAREKLLDPKPGPLVRPLIEGRDIDAGGFRVGAPRRAILYDPAILTVAERKAGASLRNPEVFRSPKVVSRQTADTLVAALDEAGDLVTLNSVHCTRSLAGDVTELTALVTLLNSPLARLFYALDGGETREILPQVHVSWLRSFPLPAGFVEVAPALAAAHGDRAAGHRAVCAAYGLSETDSVAVLATYRARYPRFAESDTRLSR